MKCFYCKAKLPSNSPLDICDPCLFHLDDVDTGITDSYEDEIRQEIESVMNKTGVTQPRFIE